MTPCLKGSPGLLWRQSALNQTLPTTTWRRQQLVKTEAAQGLLSCCPPRLAPPPRARRVMDLNSQRGSWPQGPQEPQEPSALLRWSWRRHAWSLSSRASSTCTRRMSGSGSTRR
uniref:Uncharacterized protein n=1 Tax=Molossus molossus TaxID=27622 RepID=A0A7J8E324_MOLMO|nr:hypothetical protein HJG59_009019 [Molossus molossus]